MLSLVFLLAFSYNSPKVSMTRYNTFKDLLEINVVHTELPIEQPLQLVLFLFLVLVFVLYKINLQSQFECKTNIQQWKGRGKRYIKRSFFLLLD